METFLMVEEGIVAPDFSLTSDTGDTVSLASLRGMPVVLYFYPRDDTPGCTTQACGIRDAWAEFERTGAVVLGVSPDDAASHVEFRTKYELPFSLLADPDHATAEAYGVWVERSFDGEAFMGIERSTFVIRQDGVVVRVLRNVKPTEHAADVLAALSSADG
jgi:peroxiredoxin Q/BCP